MKIIIWLAGIFVLSLIITIIRSSGFILGGLPSALLYGAMFGLCAYLCKLWDKHKKSK